MRVVIISDIHDNLANLKKVLDYCARESAGERIQTIICCGDLASVETLDYLNDNFSGTIHFTFGNADWSWEEEYKDIGKYKNTIIYKSLGETEIDGTKVAFVHYPNVAKELCETGKYDFVFYGHTHKPWTEKINNCAMLNPGNVAGALYAPTFAVWEMENNKLELIRIHDLK